MNTKTGYPNRAATNPEATLAVNNSLRLLNEAYGRHGASVIDLGRALVAIHDRLTPLKQWETFLRSEELPFRARKCQMLMHVYRTLGDLDPQTIACLPVGWSVMASLGKLPRERLLHYVAEGVIVPSTTLAQAKKLASELPNSSRQTELRWVQRTVEKLYALSRHWSEAERQHASQTLRSAIALFLEQAQKPDADDGTGREQKVQS